jgi:hypothetical protein
MFVDPGLLDINETNNNNAMNQNSSVDLIEYVAKLLLYDDIIRHVITISFGPVVHDDERYVQILKDVLPDFEACINSSGKDNVGNLKIVLKIVDQHLSQSTSISKLHRSDEKRLCFEAAFLLLYSNKEEADDSKIRTIPAFLQRYPEFKDDAMIEPTEQETLLKFRNMMKLAQLFIPAKNHKEHLMDLVTRLVEGRDQKYVTGSGEKPATRRRVLIYEREGEIRPVPRPPRTAVTAPSESQSSNSATSSNLPVCGRKRKDNDLPELPSDPLPIKPIEKTELFDTVKDTTSLALPLSLSSGSNGISIPMAPKLHQMHGRIQMKIAPQPLSHPSSLQFLHESSPRNHAGQELYQTHTPLTETLSSLLNQHNDDKFIQENLTTMQR